MKRIIGLTAIAFLLSSEPAMPSETPRSMPQDNRIREVIYSELPSFPYCRRFPLGNADRVRPASGSSMSRSAIRYRGKSPRPKIRCLSNPVSWLDRPI